VEAALIRKNLLIEEEDDRLFDDPDDDERYSKLTPAEKLAHVEARLAKLRDSLEMTCAVSILLATKTRT
jgi:hypothetical protein